MHLIYSRRSGFRMPFFISFFLSLYITPLLVIFFFVSFAMEHPYIHAAQISNSFLLCVLCTYMRNQHTYRFATIVEHIVLKNNVQLEKTCTDWNLILHQ